MITQNQLTQEIKLIKPTGSTSNIWSVEAAANENPFKETKILLTPQEVIDHQSGGIFIQEVQDFIESETEFYSNEYFYYNNLELIDLDYKIELTNNYNYNDIFKNIRITLKPEYNPLLELLPGDARDYFKNYNYSPYYYDIGDESIDFLTYSLLEEYIETDDIKDQLQDCDILNIIGQQDQDHQAIIKTANYKDLLEDIKTAWSKLIKRIREEIDEAIHEKYYEEVYYPAEETGYNNLLEQTPIYYKDL